jgi:hypothetical protein
MERELLAARVKETTVRRPGRAGPVGLNPVSPKVRAGRTVGPVLGPPEPQPASIATAARVRRAMSER